MHSSIGGSILCLIFHGSHVSLSPMCALVLTSADTDQVASSQWVSLEPSNRKQVKPDTPALMLNVAAKKAESFVLRVSSNISSRSSVRRSRSSPSPLSLSMFQVWACSLAPLRTWLRENCQVFYTNMKCIEYKSRLSNTDGEKPHLGGTYIELPRPAWGIRGTSTLFEFGFEILKHVLRGATVPKCHSNLHLSVH